MEIKAGVLATRSGQLSHALETAIRQMIIESGIDSVAATSQRIFNEILDDVIQLGLTDHDEN